ncbi:MAG: autotransporter domain-containing protein [Phycisphaerae bacterium]
MARPRWRRTTVRSAAICWLALASSAGAGMFQAGSVDVAATAPGQAVFQSVGFSQAFSRTPVVFVMPTASGADPASLRIRNVTTSGFEIAPVEPAGEDGVHPGMPNVAYLAVEPGRTEITPGVYLDAGVHTTTSTGQRAPPFGDGGAYDTVRLRHTFGSAPAVLATVQTANNEANQPPGEPSTPWLTTSVNSIQTDRFNLALERSEVADGSTVTVPERIGYLVIQTTSGTLTDSGGSPVDWQAFITNDVVRGYSEGEELIAFAPAFAGPPLVVATKAWKDGGDGGWLRRQTLTATQVGLVVDEDQFNDTERSHTTEQASLAAFERAFTADLADAPITIVWAAGAGTGDWDDTNPASNWDLWDGDPANLAPGDTLLFNDTGSATTTAVVTRAYTAGVGEVRFEESTAYTIDSSGGRLDLADGGAVTNASSELQTVDVPVVAHGAAMTIDAGAVPGGGFLFGTDATFDLSDTGGVALTVTGANDTTLAGVLSGTGGRLIKEGAGTLTLSAANTYTAGTTLAAGRLVAADDDALGTGPLTVTGPATLEQGGGVTALANDVALAADLTVDAGADLLMAGQIIGAGTVIKQGAGTLTLTADNAFLGATVAAGTLVGDTGSLAGNLAANATAVFDQAADGTFGGTLSGAGQVFKDGAGTLTLTAASPFTGTLTVRDGVVAMEGSLAGEIVNRAHLCGAGTVGGLHNEAGGTFAPGNTIDITTVVGDYTQDAGSTLEIEVDGAQPRGPGSSHDLLDVGGTATLEAGSTIQVLVANPGGFSIGETLTIIQAAGGVTDAGAAIQTAATGAAILFLRDPDFSDGDAQYAIVAELGSLLDAARGEENREIAGALDTLPPTAPGTDLNDMLSRLGGMDSGGINRALGQLNPKPLEVLGQLATDVADTYHRNLAAYTAAGRTGPMGLRAALAAPGGDALDTAPPPRPAGEGFDALPPGWDAFAQAFGLRIDQEPTDRRTGFTAEAYGGQMGIDRRSDDGARRLGLGLAAVSSDVTWARSRGEVEEDVLRIGPYVTYRPPGRGWFVDGSLTYGFHHYQTDREVPALAQTATATFCGHDVACYAGGGWDLTLGPVTVTPEASVQYLYLGREAYHEEGPAGLDFARQAGHFAQGRLGVRVRSRVEACGVTLAPTAYLGWRHRLVTDIDDFDAQFVAGGRRFGIDAVGPQRDEFVGGLGVTARLTDQASAFVQYDGSWSDERSTQSVMLGVRFDF